MMGGKSCLFALTMFLTLFGMSYALQCFKCGQYNDGVGSITPCTNYTHMHLIDCPSLEHTYCIKYISEGSTVRDCVAKCIDKDNWSAKTYCCSEDGCNASPPLATKSTFINQLFFATLIFSLTYFFNRV